MSYDKYITTPLYYVNADPHIGHTFTTVVADVMKRYFAEQGLKAYMLTGTDEHGEKIQKTAESKNKTPKEFVDEISAKFKNIWQSLNIDYDYFIRTTDDNHKKLVQDILQKLYDSGDIYFSSYEGKYCVGCERFLTEVELEDGKCVEHQKEPEIVKEENYFFKMSKYAPSLKEIIENTPDIIRPAKYKNEILNYLDGVEDLCISRPKKRVSWGIELPFDEKYVSYVWFDALLNYITATGYPDKNYIDLWSKAEHLIAKDILKTHTVYWGTMLLAMGIPMYKHLNVHGYWNMSGLKMSKSLGNVLSPMLFKEEYDYEGLRYFFLKDMRWGEDSDFTLERFIGVYNTDLANNYGNLISRTLGMMGKYFKEDSSFEIKINKDIIGVSEILSSLKNYLDNYKINFESYNFSKALGDMVKVLDSANKFVNDIKPWELFKEGKIEELKGVLSILLEVIRITSFTLVPIMPIITTKILKTIFSEFSEKEKFDDFTKIGKYKTANIKIEQKIFFTRLEIKGE